MRAIAAAGALALLVAAPASALSGGSGVSGALQVGHLTLAKGAAVKKDKARSCQAGKKSASKTGLLGSSRHHAVVACEQPPKSNLLTPDQVAKAAAAALSVLG